MLFSVYTIVRNFKKYTDLLTTRKSDITNEEYYLKRLINDMLFILQQDSCKSDLKYEYERDIVMCNEESKLLDCIHKLWKQMKVEQQMALYDISIGM